MTTGRRGCRPSRARRARAWGRSAASSWARARQVLSYTTTPPWASIRRGLSNAIRYSWRMPAGVSSLTTVRRSSSRRTTSTRSATTRSAGPTPAMLPVSLTSKVSGLPGMALTPAPSAVQRSGARCWYSSASTRCAAAPPAGSRSCQPARSPALTQAQAGDEGCPHVGGGDRRRRRRRRMRVLRLPGDQGEDRDADDEQRRHETDDGGTGAQAAAPRSGSMSSP